MRDRSADVSHWTVPAARGIRSMLMQRFRVVLPLLILAGCSVGPDYRPQSAQQLGVSAGYSVTASPTSEGARPGRLWRRS